MNTQPTSLTQYAQTNNDASDEETLMRLANRLSENIQHKKDNFTERVLRRLKNGEARRELDEDGNWVTGNYTVDGCLDGDHYSEYDVDWTAHHLGMCSCYQHNFGTVRARKVCTHVAAAIVRYGLEVAHEDDIETAFERMDEMGEKLNESAKKYITKREKIDIAVETLDMADKFSENWADRAKAQATKMQSVDGETGVWKCTGGENEGHTVELTKQGYKCDTCGEKFPTPCKLGAYVLNKMDDMDIDLDEETDDSSSKKSSSSTSSTQSSGSSSRQYHPFTRDDFEQMLSRTLWDWEDNEADDESDANFSGELAYESETLGTKDIDGETHTFCLKTFSTVNKSNEKTRDKGDDSIKTLLWDKTENAPVSGRSRTHRTKNALKNTQKKLEDIAENWDDEITTCGDGHLMVRRTGKRGEFLGCSNFPDCRETKDI